MNGSMIALVSLILIVVLISVVRLPAENTTDSYYTSSLYKNQIPIEIKNGTYYRDNKPIFFTGFTIVGTIKEQSRQGGDWNGSDNRIYSGELDRELMDEFGLNTYHRWGLQGYFFLNKYFSDSFSKDTKSFYQNVMNIHKSQLKGIAGCASIQDFILNGWDFNRGYGQVKNLIPKEAFQKNSEWHDMMPFDPSNPIGREYYRTDYREYTKYLLDNGSNPFVYELLNEPFYNSFSKENLDGFRKWILTTYGDINKANKQWGSNFGNVENAIKLLEEKQVNTYRSSAGIWVDWMEFSGDILGEHLKGFKEDILSVDKRNTKKYFTVQPTDIPNFNRINAFDYVKFMDWFDVMTIEYGGPSFGGVTQTSGEINQDPYAIGLHFNRIESTLNLDIGRAIANGKPLDDHEMACRRNVNGVRVPSNEYDLGTSLWEEIMHGVSASIIYTWGSRNWEWNTYEEAKNRTLSADYIGAYLQNPYNFPFNALQDLKRFRNEIDRVAEIVLPLPRTIGKAGIIFARRHVWLSGLEDRQNFNNLQKALMNIHFPFDYLIDYYLVKKNNLSDYKVVFAPCLKYCSDVLKNQLIDYVKNGGILIAFPDTFTADDYGKPQNPVPYLGVNFEKLNKKTAASLKFKIAVEDEENLDLVSIDNKLKIVDAEVVATDKDEKLSLVASKKLGRGKIYTLNFIKTKNSCLSTVLATIFREEKVEKEFDVRRISDSKLENSVELNVVNRKNKMFVHIANWDNGSKFSKLIIKNNNKSWYITDVVRWKQILNYGGKDKWTPEDIKKGINVSLPYQKRVLILFSEEPVDKLTGTVSMEDYRKEYESARDKEMNKTRQLGKEIQKMEDEINKKRTFSEVDRKNAFYVDLSKNVNMAFRDEESGDGKGGWTDNGDNDIRNLPVGEQVFYNVPYNIIDPDKNNNKSAIVLRGGDRVYFPMETNGISVNKKAINLYFLHASAWTDIGSRVSLFKYVINYIDGSKTEVIVEEGTCCTDWWKPNDKQLIGDDVRVAWEGR